MMENNSVWRSSVLSTLTPVKFWLSNYSIKVRTEQFRIFQQLFRINKNTRVVDIGATASESLKDSNMFEKLYPYPEGITAATIEDVGKLKALYRNISIRQIKPAKKLPFRNKYYDIAVSWATLEHVGGYKEQEFFINELLRVGKKVFITTPYRGCIYEPHSGIFFLHWLSSSWFSKICKFLHEVKVFKIFGIHPSHLII